MRRRFLLLILSLWLAACAGNSYIQYPEDTVLGIRFDALPNYPLCSLEEIRSRQLNKRCIIHVPQDGHPFTPKAVILVPEEEKNLPFKLLAIFWRSYSIGLYLSESTSLEGVNSYLTEKYGKPFTENCFRSSNHIIYVGAQQDDPRISIQYFQKNSLMGSAVCKQPQ